jgi:ERCC4-related helicase
LQTKLYNARRTLREHRKQLMHDDMDTVVLRLCADIQHAGAKHPKIVDALLKELLREETESEDEEASF